MGERDGVLGMSKYLIMCGLQPIPVKKGILRLRKRDRGRYETPDVKNNNLFLVSRAKRPFCVLCAMPHWECAQDHGIEPFSRILL